MPKFPRDVRQDAAVRAFIRAGGEEIPRRGKGSHRVVKMPNGQRVVLPVRLKSGLLRDMIKQAGLTVEEFLDLL
jgi:predicted RNA binding protein YcfA (HicA-like mRNA interferase family)